jgi:sec-independent protein translocase protein TatC
LSQIGLAVPIILLYEISIWCARMIEKKRADEDETLGDDADESVGQSPAD